MTTETDREEATRLWNSALEGKGCDYVSIIVEVIRLARATHTAMLYAGAEAGINAAAKYYAPKPAAPSIRSGVPAYKEPPQEIVDAALLVSKWTDEHGWTKWRIGGCCSEDYRPAAAAAETMAQIEYMEQFPAPYMPAAAEDGWSEQRLDAERGAPAVSAEPVASSKCPICGVDVPHGHTEAETQAYHDDQVRGDGWTSSAINPKEAGLYIIRGHKFPDDDKFHWLRNAYAYPEPREEIAMYKGDGWWHLLYNNSHRQAYVHPSHWCAIPNSKTVTAAQLSAHGAEQFLAGQRSVKGES